MFHSILVPLDGSALAEEALPAALSLAERSGGEVALVHVAGPAADSGTPGDWLEGVAGRVRDSAPEVQLRTVLLEGAPAPALHRFVLEEGIDQIVMTSHGRGGLKRLWLGSVADGLLRRAPAPILLWRPIADADPTDLAGRPSFTRILVPLDGSEPSEAIVPWADALARLYRAPLLLAAVVSAEAESPGYLPSTGGLDAALAEEAVYLEGYLETLAGGLRAGGTRVEVRVVEGPPAVDGILQLREERGADLMAFATSGRGGVARLVLGSVADKLIRAGVCPVLVFRAREEG